MSTIALVLIGVSAIGGCQLLRNSQGTSLTLPAAGAVRIGSWNVHYILAENESGTWGTQHWEQRKLPMARLFKLMNADIIAFQEMESFSSGNEDANNLTRTWLAENNPDFDFAAVGPWQSFPSTQPVFFRRSVFTLEKQGWFFFSTTPDKIYSHTFNGSYPAFASWVQLSIKGTGARLRVVNVHLDYASRSNRKQSVELIVARIKPWIEAGEHVVIAGDLNARHGSSLHALIEGAGLQFVPVHGSTYHFNRGFNLFGAIDHVAYTPSLQLLGDAVVLREKAGDVWASDHYPLVADFKLDE